ncbi:MAG: hypothetical protein ACP5QU_05125, partial [Anaerolineae bacterium]
DSFSGYHWSSISSHGIIIAMKNRLRLLLLGLTLGIILACAPLGAPPIYTLAPEQIASIVAATANIAATQTAAAQPLSSDTPTPYVTRTPFPSPTPTATFLFFTPTQPFTPTETPLPLPTVWPDWTTGDIVTFPKGSGENIGVTRYFRILQNVKVIVTRLNGVKLRPIPNKALGGKSMAAYGAILTLTGYWNRNPDLDWSFVKVIAADGKQYWVGGDEGSEIDPQRCLRFYTPETLTPSPTETATITPIVFRTLTPSITPTP